MSQATGFSFGSFVWWVGVVEDRKNDPLKIGRVKVRIYGYHGDPGSVTTDDLPWAVVSQPTDSAASLGLGTSPTGLIEGSTVWGFFMDGENAQTPIVIGVLPGAPDGKPDSNFLAQGQDLDQTIIQTKKNDRVISGSGSNRWEEPQTPAAPEYPHNQMRQTEGGHIQEFDDTPGAERYQRWHPAGTFVEIHPDGTRVDKIVSDRYTLIAGNDFVNIDGNVSVNITGNNTIVITGDSKLTVQGDLEEEVAGDYTLRVRGKYQVEVGAEHTQRAGSRFEAKAPRIDLN